LGNDSFSDNSLSDMGGLVFENKSPVMGEMYQWMLPFRKKKPAAFQPRVSKSRQHRVELIR
tara:strand:- start:1704 stop:1886 length:183 start_codon:yes stop_codon:yes gene_type:complete